MHSPMFSLEVFPPKRDAPIGTIYDALDGLEGLKPDFISVTYGHGTHADRTATARIANTIRQDYQIPTVAHLTALYSDEAKIDDALGLFTQAKVSGVLALRGDHLDGLEPVDVFLHASDLIAYIRDRKPDLKIYAACYPEGHIESESLDDDIAHLKTKVDAGASHLISQLFYDNADFYRFLDKARAAGIAVPIEAGIMPVTSAKSVLSMAAKNNTRIPKAVSAMLDKWGDDLPSLRAAGINFAAQQITNLVANDVDGIHLYTMNRPGTARHIWHNVSTLFSK
ncbi:MULTISPECIES: methylenetetrahydrofolate reductase [NAD(P)H] [Bifidobacterium]|uniref:methylenetetrahydrofolate reductase [NAD(P)H] n=1 Tax=Bifidobacterium TaxID=1678 RepID=UPI001BDD3515|nr:MULTISPECIES: methylenetetrahydrofolate reductase [NAD(P)H] [Bifidobacterium]MBT1162416.1 methylenetetrahydrofolate reductase [NAD(P)H] [Bifidobacterium sp. SO1]MBW3079643.1 methylenetetrahydrofolate reductase [NAD(P)H] [Bifidobacterium simiiventris]